MDELKIPLVGMVHGFSGVGKSRLAASGPTPCCVADLEGRGHYLPYPKTYWDPAAGAPPEADGSWTHCIVRITKYANLELLKQWIESGQHPFKSLAFDSLMEAQKRFIDDLAGVQQLKDYDWGTVLRNLEGMVRDFRDAAVMPNNPLEVVTTVVGTRETAPGQPGSRFVPLLQGQLRDTLPYYTDWCGYLYIGPPDEEGNTPRYMQVQPSASVVAKDNTSMLGGPILASPNLNDLWVAIKERTS